MNPTLQKLASRVELQKKVNAFLNNLVEALALMSVCMSGLCRNKIALNKAGAKLTCVIALALTIADTYSPATGRALRQGAGFGVGAMLVGFP